VDECKPLVVGRATVAGELARPVWFGPVVPGRGFHSSTSQLNLSRF